MLCYHPVQMITVGNIVNRLKVLLLRVIPILVTVNQLQQALVVVLIECVSGPGFILCRFIQLLQNPLHHVIRLFYAINQVKTLRCLIQRHKPELA